MPKDTITIFVNGIKSEVENADTISYAHLCRLAVQPSAYTPSIMYYITPNDKKRTLRAGESAPLRENARYSVMISGYG